MSAQILEFSAVNGRESVKGRWTRCTVCNHRWPAVEPLYRMHTACTNPECGAMCYIGNDEGRNGR